MPTAACGWQTVLHGRDGRVGLHGCSACRRGNVNLGGRGGIAAAVALIQP